PRELSSVVMDRGEEFIGTYIGPNGETIIRPPGLSDNPGAVCGPASVAALLGLVLALRPIAFWKRGLCAGMAFAGVAAIFLSHVRSSLLIACRMRVVSFFLLVLQHQRKRAIAFMGLSVALIVGGLVLASLLGGEAGIDRFTTLFEDDPTTVYTRNRGFMLYDTVTYLSEYPLGAGLGRWGMMRVYFGDEGNANSPSMWAELQFPAWALDGGFIVLILYSCMLLIDIWHECSVCFRWRKTSIASDLAVIVASNMGVLALLFSFTPFTTALGAQYWFLAG